jgi:hypothetical protein
MTPQRLGVAAVSVGLIVLALALVPAAGQAASCNSSNASASAVQAKGVTCSQANKVIGYDLSNSSCKGQPCSFTKFKIRWSCVSHQTGRNTCDGKKEGNKVSVSFQYGGGDH